MTLRSFSMSYYTLLASQATSPGFLYMSGDTATDSGSSTIATGTFTQYGTVTTVTDGVDYRNGWQHDSGHYYYSTGSNTTISGGTGESYTTWVKVSPSLPTGSYVVMSSLGNLGQTYQSGLRVTILKAAGGELTVGFYSTSSTGAVSNTSYDGTFLSDGAWHHLAYSKTGTASGGGSIWIDGVLKTSTGVGPNRGPARVTLGSSRTTNTGAATTGLYLDEQAFYPYPLTDTQVQAQASYNWAAAPVSYNATPATASTLMNDASVSLATPGGYTAQAMTASSLMSDPAVSAYKNAGTLRTTSPMVYRAVGTSWTDVSTFTNLTFGPTDANNKYLVQVPDIDNLFDANVEITSVDLFLRLSYIGDASLAASITVKAATLTGGNTYTTGSTLSITSLTNQAVGLIVQTSIPLDTEWLELHVPASNQNIFFNNPGKSLSGSHFDVVSVSLAGSTAAPATADASMPGPVVSAAGNVSVAAQTALGNAEMTEVPWSIEIISTPATAAAEARTAFIKGTTQTYADVATATAEMIESGLGMEREFVWNAKPARMLNGWVVNPKEVDTDALDPYWNRVTGRATEGTLPSRNGEWYRFNEGSGSNVLRYDLTTGKPLPFNPPVAGGVLEGLFDRGIPAPNGKRGVRLTSARMNVTIADTYYSGTGLGPGGEYNGSSLEFTLRVDPGHTGRMDIANGSMDNVMNVGNATSRVFINVGVRDGKIYAAERAGGTSMKRIDDGLWHHVVITPGPGYNTTELGGTQYPIQIWIDGMLDRTLRRHENNNGGATVQGNRLARPDTYFGDDTGYPFKGEITEIIARSAPLSGSQITDLYLDMFGYTAIRAGVIGEVAAESLKGHRAATNMKRMLVLSWKIPFSLHAPTSGNTDLEDYVGASLENLTDPAYRHSITPNVWKDNAILSPMIGWGLDGEDQVGSYLLTYQNVNMVWTSGVPYTAVSEEARARMGTYGDETGRAGYGGVFRDMTTGEPRMINLQEDIDLDLFDIIAFQAYPNPVNLTQRERLMYEDFLNSVNTALVDGHKLWVTDPALAADLGWVSDVDEVPVLTNMGSDGRYDNVEGNDVRGYEVAPHVGLNGAAITKPANGSMPVLPTGIPNGPDYGEQNLWRWDIHRNNGYRVVTEVPGLTNLDSWEVNEAYLRDRQVLVAESEQHEHWGYDLENRTSEDWVGEEVRDGEPVLTIPSTGDGLREGDQFYDWSWIDAAFDVFPDKGFGILPQAGAYMRMWRTWAVAPGGLRVGTPVTTFRTHMHNDYGQEIVNPYRNHIRNFVIRAGDRLPDGRRVGGFAYVDLAEQPVFGALAGKMIVIDERERPGILPGGRGELLRTPGFRLETPYSHNWDWITLGRETYMGSGLFAEVPQKAIAVKKAVKIGRKRYMTITSSKIIPAFSFPVAQPRMRVYRQHMVNHMTWNARGVAWLTAMTSNTGDMRYNAQGFVGNAEMKNVTTEIDRDIEVNAAVAGGNGQIVAPAEATIREVLVFAYPGTAAAVMNGLSGAIRVEPATSFGDMPQGTGRPTSEQEILYFTLAYNIKPIYLRMEEN